MIAAGGQTTSLRREASGRTGRSTVATMDAAAPERSVAYTGPEARSTAAVATRTSRRFSRASRWATTPSNSILLSERRRPVVTMRRRARHRGGQ